MTPKFDLTAGTPRTLDEFKALEQALTQFIDNAHDPEDRSEAEAISVTAAEAVQERLAAEWAKLAETKREQTRER